MSFESRTVEDRARDIRVPMGYYRCLGRYFDDLKLSILDEAIRQAASDASKPKTNSITIDHILQAAGTAFPEAKSNLNTALRQLESDYARRKAS